MSEPNGEPPEWPGVRLRRHLHDHQVRHLRRHGGRRWGPWTRLGWFIRARMHRRLFMGFGFAIAVSAAVMHMIAAHSQGLGRWQYAGLSLVLMTLLWGITGRVARGIARPVAELARVAAELGAGNLQSRVRLHWRDSGELSLLAAVFNDMADRIERQMADQRELLAGVSHELRTPLARIRILVELVRDGAAPGRLDEIEREVLEMDALVGELLASSRLDFSAPATRPLDGADAARRALDRAGLSDDLLETKGETRINADPTLLARALANLLDNARKHGGGLVKLRVVEMEDVVAFEADDSGPGVPTEDPDRIFRPFAPPANGQSREPGSLGLGLALVRRIAEAHGGKAYAMNRPEGGARIGFELARRAEESTVPAQS